MTRPLSILAPTRYPWRFNGPRSSRHNVSVRLFLPLNKLSPKIEGITIFNPFPLRRFDLVHAFNRIPVGPTPFIIGFESHLPRAFGYEQSTLFRIMSDMLASNNCKGIIAVSEFARRQFLNQHKGSSRLDALAAKLSVRYPNLPISSEAAAFEWQAGAPLRFIFVGNHFGRKGGSVAVRLAELALKRGLSVQVDIISALEMGDASWVGPTRKPYWDRDLQLLQSLPNVRHIPNLPNQEVIDLVRKAHFALLPTFSDTFGYSAIEAMACGTPVIATRQSALPEFITDGRNGLLLDLEIDAAGEWRHIGYSDRASPDYEALFEREVDRMTADCLTKIESYMQAPSSYLALRSEAHRTAKTLFSAADASLFWDDFYVKALTL